MYLGISEDVSRAKTNNSLKFRRAAPRLSAQMYLVLSKSGPTLALFPGLAISTAVLACNLFGDMLRDVLDPRLRRGTE